MGRKIVHNVSDATRGPQARREREEPQLFPAEAIAPPRYRTREDRPVLSATRDDAARPSANLASLERRRTTPVVRRGRPLRYFTIIGVIAVIAGGLAGARYLMSAPSPVENAVVAPPQPIPAEPSAPAPPKPPAAAVVAPIPDTPAVHHAAAENAAIKPPDQFAPAAPSTPPAKPVMPAGAASGMPERAATAGPPAAAPPAPLSRAGEASPPASPAAAADAPVPAPPLRKPVLADRHADIQRSAEPHKAPRRPEPRKVVHSVRLPVSPSSPSTLSPTRPEDQEAAFGQLMTRLTGGVKTAGSSPAAGSVKPAGDTLTPPTAGMPDPFSAPAPEETGRQ